MSVRTDGRYEITITHGTFGSGAAYDWQVVAPDGRQREGRTWAPAWLWVARWSARKAARWLMKSAGDKPAAHYFLRPNFVKDTS